MLYALISILFAVGVIYRSDFISSDSSLSFFARYRKLMLLLAIPIIPIVLINMLGSSGRWVTPEENLREAEENRKGTNLMAAHEYQLMAAPDSVPLYFQYVEAAKRNLISECAYIDFERFSEDPLVLQLATEYAMISCRDLSKIGTKKYPVELDVESTRFINYIRGIEAEKNGEYDLAEKHYIRETQLNPTFQKGFVALYEFYSVYKPDEMARFIKDPRYASALPLEILNFEFFRLGFYGDYIGTIIEERFYHIGLIAFLAGLTIAIMWIFFFRNLSHLSRVPWVQIIVVFLGGVLFTNFCLPIYDYFHYVLHFYPTGAAGHDLAYSIVVIGFSEEIVKFIPWLLIGYLMRGLKEPFHYILYASVAALGFSFAENWLYLEDAQNIVIRAIMSTMAHMFDASFVAFGVILARYNAKTIALKIAFPFLGLIGAAVAHGFYDYWLINDATDNLSFITYFFFIITTYLWFFIIKNTLEHSYYLTKKTFNEIRLLDTLMFSMFVIMVMEYVILSVQYGYSYGNIELGISAWTITAFLVLMSFILSNFAVRKGWSPFNIPLSLEAARMLTLPKFNDGNGIPPEEDMSEDTIGQRLKFYLEDTNPFLRTLLPATGVCEEEIKLNDQYGWFIFKMDQPMNITDYDQHHVIVRCREANKTLQRRGVEIYFLLIPSNISVSDRSINSAKEFKFAGRVFSKPA